MNANEVSPRDDLEPNSDPHERLDAVEDQIEALKDKMDNLNSLRNSITSAFCIAVPLCMINSATQGVSWVLSDGRFKQTLNEPITQDWVTRESQSVMALSGGAGLVLFVVWAAIFFGMRRKIKNKDKELEKNLRIRREIQREIRKAEEKK